MLEQHTTQTFKVGYYTSIIGAIIILLWIGIFKFTPSEAKAIEPLIKNHITTKWLYKYITTQTISNIIGCIEITIAIALAISIKYTQIKKYAAWGMIATFTITLSYIFTTPKTFKIIDNIPITDFFILKDITLLGLAIMILGYNTQNTPKK